MVEGTLSDSSSTSQDVSSDSMRLNTSSSSAAVASRLYMNGTARTSNHRGFGSEPELMQFSDTENSIHDLNEICTQMTTLSKRVNEMEEERMTTAEERSRLKTENAVLTERIHILEEQFQASEQRWKEKLEEEKARNKDILSRMEREKQLEIESCLLKYQVLDKDYGNQKKERDKLNEEIVRLQAELKKEKENVNEANMLCESLEEERIKLEKEFKKFREEAQQDIDSSSELVEELSRQTDELKRQKYERVPRQGSISDQISSLESEIERLRTENKRLESQNEDLQAQMLHESFERGQNLLADRLPSLAEELNGKDSTELMNALKEQEICNQKLRVYINGILMRVIELHPEILEIKEEGHNSSASGS